MLNEQDHIDIDGFVIDLLAHPDELEAIRAAVLDAGEQMADYVKQGMAPAAISAEIHREADELLDGARQTNPEMKNITCLKGCAHCCRQLVAVTSVEADELLEVAQRDHIKINYRQLVRQARCTSPQDWAALDKPDRDCIFLKDNLCQVYDSRPLACRKFFTIGDPELCNIEKNPGGQIPIIFNIRPEILTIAGLNTFDSGLLPQMLLNAIHATQPTKENPS